MNTIWALLGAAVVAALGIVIGYDGLARDRGIEGAVVGRVLASGPASRAGLRGLGADDELGDVITGVNDQEIHGEADLYEALEPYRAGEEVLVRINRPDRSGRSSEELRIRLESLR